MVDKIKALKIETSAGGTQIDVYPTETNVTQDYISAKGMSFEFSDIEVLDLSADSVIQAPAIATMLINRKEIPDNSKVYVISSDYEAIIFDKYTLTGSIKLDGELTILG